MKKLRNVPVLPSLFTLANLVCGFFAIVVAARVGFPESGDLPTTAEIVFKNPAAAVRLFDASDPTHNCMLSGILIFLAMIFDAVDGYVARLAKQTTEFGAQLDSLCDLVTFGVAPAFLLVKICPSFTVEHRDAVWVIAAAFTACTALRLAKFNVESADDTDHLNFKGLPSPAAAANIASCAILFYSLRREGNSFLYAEQLDLALQTALPFYALLVAALMVSPIAYPHVVNQSLRGTRSFSYLVGLIFAGVSIMVIRSFSLPILCLMFTLSGPIMFLRNQIRDRTAVSPPSSNF